MHSFFFFPLPEYKKRRREKLFHFEIRKSGEREKERHIKHVFGFSLKKDSSPSTVPAVVTIYSKSNM